MDSLSSWESMLFRNEMGTAACLGMTLLLPYVKCFLLIKMSQWTQNQRKEDSFCPLSTKQAASLLSQRYLINLLRVLSGVSVLWERSSDTAVAAKWNQWWMTCQNGPRRLPRRLCWQPQLSHLTFGISRANRGSCWPQMWHMNIAPVIAHLSLSLSQRTHFRSHIIKWNLL